MSSISGKIIIGSEEWYAFPEMGIPAIKARVDSGAKTRIQLASATLALSRSF